jgi:hypothetical protein
LIATESTEKGSVNSGRYIYKADEEKLNQLEQRSTEIINAFLKELEQGLLVDLDQKIKEAGSQIEAISRQNAEFHVRATDYLLAEQEQLKEQIIQQANRLGEATSAYQQTREEIQRAIRQCHRNAMLSRYTPTIEQSKLSELLQKRGHAIEYFVSLLDISHEGRGVYLLWHEDQLEYVGKTISRSVRERLATHNIYKEGRHYLIGIVLITDDKERDRMEKLLIRALFPKKNIKDRISEYQKQLDI